MTKILSSRTPQGGEHARINEARNTPKGVQLQLLSELLLEVK